MHFIYLFEIENFGNLYHFCETIWVRDECFYLIRENYNTQKKKKKKKVLIWKNNYSQKVNAIELTKINKLKKISNQQRSCGGALLRQRICVWIY